MMGLICSCFGYGNQEPGEAAGSHGSNSPPLGNVVNKYKSIFHGGRVVAAASSNEAGIATAATATATTTAPAAVPIQPEVQTHLNGCSTHYDFLLSGQIIQSVNKDAALAGNYVQPHRKSDVQRGSKPVAKVGGQTKVKLLVDFEDSSDTFPLSVDEDVCPTCLEEYDEENPKIVTQCNHHYHLACIFEWMERSASCPVCGKLMLFEQMT